MITRGVAIWSQVRRWLSPTEWFVRWFRLPRVTEPLPERGLVLVQIDGLPRGQLQRAVDDGRMPFLRSLLDREHYFLHDLYSGLPASTASVQGELFYGTKCAVPAFGFRDHRNGEVVRMFSREVAADVEARIADHPGILDGGSAYCNVYGGGASEIHFCASSLGWSEIMSSVNSWKLVMLLIWHVWSILRVVGLLFVECVLALAGFVQGALSGREYWQELLMIPARVVVVILMRELAIIGARMDVMRGLPIVQLNLMGYDEQAHRRGPESVFAHRALKGIDQSMRRLWNAAHRSGRRNYDVWVYSDHGQVRSTPFEFVAGATLTQVAMTAVDQICGPASRKPDSSGREGSGTRASWLSAGWLVGKLFGADDTAPHNGGAVQVAGLGPLGLIYTNRDLTTSQRLELGECLVREYGVPLAFVRTGRTVIAFTVVGQFNLRDEPEQVFGADHPFLADITTDMTRLCNHPDAGDLVVSGWVRDGDSLSFAVQHGAHAGPSPEETGAFAILPRDVHLIENGKGYLRPNDLGLAVSNFLHPEITKFSNEAWISPSQHIRIMTYNVHACVGMDQRLDPRRISRVISQSQADVVALQELDVCRARSGFRDQAQEIARLLEMECQFHPAWQLEEEGYGDAILSRLPIRLVRKGPLPSTTTKREPRGAIWMEVELEAGLTVQIINTHLSLYPGERKLQAESLAKDWVRAAQERGATIVCGDLNAQPGSPAYRCLSQNTRDVQSHSLRSKPSPTFFSPRPLARIDHVFVSHDILVKEARVLDSRLASSASDHLPLVADVIVPQTSVQGEFLKARSQ